MFPYCPLPIGIFSICSNAPPFIDYFDYIGFLSFISNQFSCSVVSNSLRPNGLQHARLPCPSPAPRAYSNSCPSSWWCHPTHLILYCPLLLLPSIFPSIRIFCNESVLRIRWPVLEFQLQHHSFQWMFRTVFL